MISPDITFIPPKTVHLLLNELKQVKWNDVVKNKSCEQACNDLISTLQNILNKYRKNKKRKPNQKRTLPWFTAEILSLMIKRDASLKKYNKTGQLTQHLIYMYKGLRNHVTATIRKAKANFFLTLIKEAKGNSKLLWRNIDKLLGKHKNKNELQLKMNRS